MRETTLSYDEPVSDPQPRFASAEEIALAERLRHKIEERYLGKAQNENGRSSDELKKAA